MDNLENYANQPLEISSETLNSDKIRFEKTNKLLGDIPETSKPLQLKEKASDIAKDFLASIEENKNTILEHYPNITNYEYDQIAKRAIGILYQETGAGSSLKYKLKEHGHHMFGGNGEKQQNKPDGNESQSSRSDNPFISRIEGPHSLMDISRESRKGYGEKKGGWSRGYTQIKFDQNFDENDKQYLKTFGIENADDLTDIKKCGIATMVSLINNYNNIIIPMKSDPFWTNDAEIITVTFNETKKGKHIKEDFAKGKILPNLGRARTAAELQEVINKWGEKYGGILKQETNIRKGFTKNDDFFNMLYYTRNKPTQIAYGTATPDTNQYVQNCQSFISKNIQED